MSSPMYDYIFQPSKCTVTRFSLTMGTYTSQRKLDVFKGFCGLMDKASASGAEDCRFESCQRRYSIFAGVLLQC